MFSGFAGCSKLTEIINTNYVYWEGECKKEAAEDDEKSSEEVKNESESKGKSNSKK